MADKPDLTAMPSAAEEVLAQMFMQGPVWDGNLVSKSGRDELLGRGFAMRVDGWQTLTKAGLLRAINTDYKSWENQAMFRKQGRN